MKPNPGPECDWGKADFPASVAELLSARCDAALMLAYPISPLVSHIHAH